MSRLVGSREYKVERCYGSDKIFELSKCLVIKNLQIDIFCIILHRRSYCIHYFASVVVDFGAINRGWFRSSAG